MSSDRTMVMGVIEGVTSQQLLHHRSQLCASEHRLAWMVCSTLFKDISNLKFLGFQRVSCVALGSAPFICCFFFFSPLASWKTLTFFFFFFLFNCVKSAWSEKAKKKLSDDKRVYSYVFVLGGAKDHINQKLC